MSVHNAAKGLLTLKRKRDIMGLEIFCKNEKCEEDK